MASAPLTAARLSAAAVLAAGAAAAPLNWSWATPQTFIHCSNSSGPLSAAAVAAMAASSFTVIEKYQALLQPPVRAGGEEKVIEAARAVRAANANATMIFYFAVDYTREWYDLGRWFDEHSYLQVHDADGRRANHTDSDGGAPNNWGIFDWAQPDARDAWIDRIASVVSTSDLNGNNLFDGVFIDGYRGASGWADGLIPNATAAEKTAWLAGATLLGPALADALGNETIRFINPGQVFDSFPGYSANSIEFFGPDDDDIKFLQSIVGTFPTIEVHAYIGADVGLFNLTLAAYLIGVGPGAYFGTGAEWSQCDDWLIPHFEFDEALGAPDALGAYNGSAWTRSFAGGATTVVLDTGSAGQAACAPDTVGAEGWVIDGTQQFFALAASNSTARVYNVTCTDKCSTSWHSAEATMAPPFTSAHIKFNMQPGFQPVQYDFTFDQSCTVTSNGWCAIGKNPKCVPIATKKSCIRWASGKTTGNAC